MSSSKLVSVGLLAIVTSTSVAAQPALFDIAGFSNSPINIEGMGLPSGEIAVTQAQNPPLTTTPSTSGYDLREPAAVASSSRWRWPSLGNRSQLTGDIFAGFRYDTDANQAAETFGPGQVQIVTPKNLQKQADWSFSTRANLSHTYSFARKSQQTWETNISFYDQRFLHISHNYDLTQAQVDTGPRFAVAKIGRSTLSIRPLGSFAWIGYGEKTYASLYGGGLSANIGAPKWNATLTGVGRFGNYADSPVRPETSPFTSPESQPSSTGPGFQPSFTGPEFQLSLSSSITINPATQISPSFSWYRANGRTGSSSRQGPGASITLFRDLTVLHRTAQLAISGSVQQLKFDEPDPATQPAVRRRDTEWTGSSSLSIPLVRAGSPILRSIRAVFEYQFYRNASNVSPLEDHTVTIGVRAAM